MGSEAGIAEEVAAVIEAENADATAQAPSHEAKNDAGTEGDSAAESQQTGDPAAPSNSTQDAAEQGADDSQGGEPSAPETTPTTDKQPAGQADKQFEITPELRKAALEQLAAMAKPVTAPAQTGAPAQNPAAQAPATQQAQGAADPASAAFDPAAFTKAIADEYGENVAKVFKPLAEQHAAAVKQLSELSTLAGQVAEIQAERQAIARSKTIDEFAKVVTNIKGAEAVFGKSMAEAEKDPKKAEQWDRAWNLARSYVKANADTNGGKPTISFKDAVMSAVAVVLETTTVPQATQNVRAAVTQRSKQRTLSPSSAPRKAPSSGPLDDDQVVKELEEQMASMQG